MQYKKSWRKILPLMLAVMLVLGLTPTVAFAAPSLYANHDGGGEGATFTEDVAVTVTVTVSEATEETPVTIGAAEYYDGYPSSITASKNLQPGNNGSVEDTISITIPKNTSSEEKWYVVYAKIDGAAEWQGLSNMIKMPATGTPVPDVPAEFYPRATAKSLTEVTLSWDAAAPSDNVIRYEYKIGLPESEVTDWTPVGLSTSVNVTGLSNEIGYTFLVRAVNAYGNGPVGAVFGRPTDVPPGEPTNFKTTEITDTTISVSWDAPTSGGPAGWYQISKDGGASWIDLTDVRAYSFERLTPGTSYTLSVRGRNSLEGTPASINVTTTGGTLTGTATINNTAPKVGDTLTASLSGGNNTGTLSYAWKVGGEAKGTNSNTYTVAAADVGKTVVVEITSSVETGTRTSAATAAVAAATQPPAPVITISTQPAANSTVTQGDELSLSVAATVTQGAALTYQWQVSSTSATDGFGNIPPATNATFGVDTNNAGGVHYYRCVISADGAASVTSSVAKVIVEPKVPDVTETDTPSVKPDDPINLDMNGVKTAYISIGLGTSPESTPSSLARAGQATVTVTGSAVTASPTSLTADGNVIVTATQAGTATIHIAFSGGALAEGNIDYDKTITVNVADTSGGTNPPPYTPPAGGGTPTTPAAPNVVTTLPTATVTPTEPPAETVASAETAVTAANFGDVATVTVAAPAIAVSAGSDSLTVISFTMPETVNTDTISTMAILNEDGTLTPVPTRIGTDGKITTLIAGDVTLVPLTVQTGFTDLGVLTPEVRAEVNRAADLMIVNGIGGGNFAPSVEVTIQQTVTMFMRALGIPVDYATAMTTATAHGLTTSTLPKAPMSRIGTAAVIVNSLKDIGMKPTITKAEADELLKSFADLADLTEAEREAMAICVKLGIFRGNTDGTMAPNGVLLRSQMASLAVRLQDVVLGTGAN